MSASAIRSMTNDQPILPASGAFSEPIPRVTAYSLITWTFGRGSVIWRIWPAVIFHTVFAAGVVTLSMRNIINLEIPSVMLTVLGVVIGFVISYRAMSGYERYWMGRTCWSDVIKNSRTLGRLIWIHVPPRLTPKSPEEVQTGKSTRSTEELSKVMEEKGMAIDLIEGFAVALKHHLRGELGIYYEDLYHLISPLHDHHHARSERDVENVFSSRRTQQVTTHTARHEENPSAVRLHEADPIIPPINAYGTFDPAKLTANDSTSPSGHLLRRSPSSISQLSNSSAQSRHQALLPSSQSPNQDTILNKISGDLIPFAGIITWLTKQVNPQTLEVLPPGFQEVDPSPSHGSYGRHRRRWQGPMHLVSSIKHRPRVAGGGRNLPLEVLSCLSQWCSILEDRGTVPGTSLGAMIGAIAAFEDSLSALERILTTPLPFVYSVHINTVWVYLFFLPFQLVTQFGYHTIPGVAIAAFIYLGFIAAGEEIEQPFGYDDNDLDLDLFCLDIIHMDMKQLKLTPCLNAYIGSAGR
ncbi:UPF0187-domain-containing protein [Phlegmacium glaucopus]|nr:UPF0187-domain-containing protein [Phlegmacium glaucopus]